jgi:hypothetical protein
MEDEIRELLNEEIKAGIQDLSNLQAGSEEKSKAIDGLATLYKLRIEEGKIDLDYNEKFYRRIMEEEKAKREDELKEKQLNSDKEFKVRELDLKDKQLYSDKDLKSRELDLKERQNYNDETFHTVDGQMKIDQMKMDTWIQYLKLGVEVAGVIVPVIFYASWMKKGFKFEETGTYTSTTFKGLFNRFKPTK